MKLNELLDQIAGGLDIKLISGPEKCCFYREHDEDEYDAESSIEELDNVHKILKNHGVVHSAILIDDKGARKAGTRHIDILLSENVDWVDLMPTKYTFSVHICNWDTPISASSKQEMKEKILNMTIRDAIQLSKEKVKDCIDIDDEDIDVLDEL